MYKAIVDFVDLQDNNHRYHAGDSFPREGYDPGEDRIKELLSDSNLRGIAIIAEEKLKKEKVPANKSKKDKKKNDAE